MIVTERIDHSILSNNILHVCFHQNFFRIKIFEFRMISMWIFNYG